MGHGWDGLIRYRTLETSRKSELMPEAKKYEKRSRYRKKGKGCLSIRSKQGGR